MAKALNFAKNLFNLTKGVGLNKPKEGSSTSGQMDNQPGSPGQSPGMFNVGSFLGAIEQTNGLSRANRYLVTIDLPRGAWAQGLDTAAQQLMFFCDNINIPGAQVTPFDHKRNAIGPFDRRAGNIIPAEITASFMLDALGRNHAFFQKWVSNIVYMGSSAAAAENQVDPTTGAAFGELGYRKDYITTMRIETFDMAANKINTLTAYEVWPSVLGDVTLGWAQNDEVPRLTVNFQLRHWVATNHELPEGQDLFNGDSFFSSRALSPMEQLLRIGQTGTALKASWKTPNNVGDVINVLSNAQTFLGAIGGTKS